MWAPAFTLALVVGASALSLAACSPTPPEDSPTPIPSPAPTGDVFTTEDGVRFSVEVVASNLQIPWSLAFAPDGRLFVTERPGRVRIFNLQAATSELALTLDDAFTQGEAGEIGRAHV